MDVFKVEGKVRGLARQMEQDIVAEAMRLYYSGGVEPSCYNDRDYALPKILVTAAAHAKKDIFRPLHPGDYEDMKNLMNL